MEQEAGSQAPHSYFCPGNFSCAFPVNKRSSSSVIIDPLLIDVPLHSFSLFELAVANRGMRLANTGKAAACIQTLTMLQKRLGQLQQSVCLHVLTV